MEKLYKKLCSNFSLKDGYCINDLLKILNNYEINENKYMSLNKYIKIYINIKMHENLSNETISMYTITLKHFSKFYKNKSLNSIDKSTIQKFINYLLDKSLKQTSIKYYLSILKGFFNYLENENVIKNNPCKTIKFKCNYNYKHSLSENEINDIRNNCKTMREELLVEFMLETGCRVSELINIKVKDINFSANEISVTGKGNKTRTIFINDKLNNLLKSNINDSEYVFSSTRYPYQKLQRFSINAILKKIGDRCNIKINPHKFRHTFATLAYDKGMDIISIQKILGHDNLQTTQLYTDINLTKIKNQYNKCFNI